ncbi:transposase [Acinetobacter sp. BSP-28]|uniref:transposase n=1 Tax=Acinetobacter sp. BSP-28 TaxID=3344661 RepID=UPI003770730F
MFTVSVPKKRRKYSTEFKINILKVYQDLKTSITSVALQHGINTNSTIELQWQASETLALAELIKVLAT